MSAYVADPDRFRADRWGASTPVWRIMDTHNGGQECAGPFPTMQDAIVRQDRLNRLWALVGAFPGRWGESPDEDGATLEEHGERRYAAILHNTSDDALGEYIVSVHETMPDALKQIADDVLDGVGCPIGVVDLDSGAPHGVHIATPVVSDIGGEGAFDVPWDDPDIPALEPGEGATSLQTT